MSDRLNTGLLLYIATRSLESRILQSLAAAGYGDLSSPLTRVLQNLEPTGSRLTVVAERALITKQNAKYLVDQLERGGYVERRPDPTDGRAILITSTQRGKDTGKVALATITQVLAEWEAHLGARDLKLLNQVLTKLRQITDPYA